MHPAASRKPASESRRHKGDGPARGPAFALAVLAALAVAGCEEQAKRTGTYVPAKAGMKQVKEKPPEVALEKSWEEPLPFRVCLGHARDESAPQRGLDAEAQDVTKALAKALRTHDLFEEILVPPPEESTALDSQLAYAAAQGCDLLIHPTVLERNIEFVEQRTDGGKVIQSILSVMGPIPPAAEVNYDIHSGNIKVRYEVYSVRNAKQVYAQTVGIRLARAYTKTDGSDGEKSHWTLIASKLTPIALDNYVNLFLNEFGSTFHAKAQEAEFRDRVVAYARKPDQGPGPATGAMGPVLQRWAVIIGISNYRHRGKWNLGNLRYAARDAATLAGYLQSDTGGRFDHVHVLTNRQATTAHIRATLKEELRGVQPGDLVVIFWAGHGSPDPHDPDDLYLVTYDTDPQHMPSTAYSMEEFKSDIANLKAERVLVLADTCHSAGITDPNIGLRGEQENQIVKGFRGIGVQPKAGAMGGPMRLIFTSCETGEMSRESADLGGGHGVFSWFFLEGIKGKADHQPQTGGNEDGVVTLGELIEYTRDRVKRFTGNQQHPDTAGRFDRHLPMVSAAGGASAAQGTDEP